MEYFDAQAQFHRAIKGLRSALQSQPPDLKTAARHIHRLREIYRWPVARSLFKAVVVAELQACVAAFPFLSQIALAQAGLAVPPPLTKEQLDNAKLEFEHSLQEERDYVRENFLSEVEESEEDQDDESQDESDDETAKPFNDWDDHDLEYE